jgi:hypothetical protein
MNKLEVIYKQSRSLYSGSGLTGYNESSGSTGLTSFRQAVGFSSANGGRVILPMNGMSADSYFQVVKVNSNWQSLMMRDQ